MIIFEEINQNWTLSLSPRADAFTSIGTTDKYNVWRNQTVVLDTLDLPESILASVPGCIHTDLITAGIIADISVDGRESDQMWIWKSDSIYRTHIKKNSSTNRASLKFHGLDTLASIFINGRLVLSTKNMHRSYEIEITEQLSVGDVDLEVRFKAPLTDAEEQIEKLGLYPRPLDMPYNYQRKMACSYGWDWGPVTISSGIWKKVELIKWDSAYLSSVSVLPSVDKQVPTLTVRPKIVGIREGHRVQILVLDGENVIAEEIIPAELDSFTFKVPSAQLWQPRGRGDQKLYSVEVQLFHDGKILQKEVKRVGFRTVELDTSAINSPDFPGVNSFALKVNGLRLWIQGVNWIPDDPFPTRVTRERYEIRIKDMLEANVNAIRVWGGGIYESEDFYNLCDQEGVVVWQDFLFACAAYPEIPEMFEEVELEAAEAVLRLENHPSLVMWCGGNECIEGFQYWGWKETLAGKPWGETFYRQTIDQIVKELDRTRPYIPGSPFSTHSDDVNSFKSGTNHIWDVWNEVGYQRYEDYTPPFAAEFGFNGPGSWSMLTQTIGKKTLDSDDPDVAIHQKALNGMAKVADGLSREFAIPPTQGVPWYFAAALDQARAVEVGLKHFRSQNEICSGAFLWQFNDMWPAISWSVVDYTGFRKIAWHAMKSAYQPRTIAIGRVDQGAQLAIFNNTQEDWISTVQISLVDSSGNIVNQSNFDFALEAFGTTKHKLANVFPQILSLEFEGFIHAKSGGIRAARRSTLSPAKLAPKQKLMYKTTIELGVLYAEVVAVNYLHELCLLSEVIDIGTQVDSQLISLLPGDSHTFVVTGSLEALMRIEAEIESLLWSHNRLVSP